MNRNDIKATPQHRLNRTSDEDIVMITPEHLDIATNSIVMLENQNVGLANDIQDQSSDVQKNTSYKLRRLRHASTCFMLATSLLTHGFIWDIEKDEDKYIIALGIIDEDFPEPAVVISDAALNEMALVGLRDLAFQDPWCSNIAIRVNSDEIPTGIPDSGGYVELPHQDVDSGVVELDALLCANENTFEIIGRTLAIYMRTDPYIPQGDDAPSIAVTFADTPENTAYCKDAKEQIADIAHQSLTKVPFLDINVVTIKVDPRVSDHPCDK